VVECSDNFATKFLVNDAAVAAGIPAVFASVYQYEGQLQVYRPRPDWPCLRCLWPQAPRDGLVGNCSEAGVLGPVPAALGSLQAMEALKILLGLDSAAVPAVHVLDLLNLQWRTLRAARRAECDHAGLRPATEAAFEAGDLEVEFATLAEARAAGLTLVDIREPWEREAGTPGEPIALHLPLSRLLDGVVAFPPVEPCLIVCAHGVRSLALTEHLRRLGHQRVYSLRGGLTAVTA
ncbi:MAG TPA: ThiF family adenylyltransferase, partial [Steroidobacteraceae bacterium]|nr:ThiF family adenylyltransferase [Steroidobacteraceae bacterium]